MITPHGCLRGRRRTWTPGDPKEHEWSVAEARRRGYVQQPPGGYECAASAAEGGMVPALELEGSAALTPGHYADIMPQRLAAYNGRPSYNSTQPLFMRHVATSGVVTATR